MILNFKKILEAETQMKEGMVGAVLGFKDCMYAIWLQCASSSHFMLAVHEMQERNITDTRSQVFIFYIEPISCCSMFRDHLDQHELSGQLSVEFYDSYKEGGGPVVLWRQWSFFVCTDSACRQLFLHPSHCE